MTHFEELFRARQAEGCHVLVTSGSDSYHSDVLYGTRDESLGYVINYSVWECGAGARRSIDHMIDQLRSRHPSLLILCDRMLAADPNDCAGTRNMIFHQFGAHAATIRPRSLALASMHPDKHFFLNLSEDKTLDQWHQNPFIFMSDGWNQVATRAIPETRLGPFARRRDDLTRDLFVPRSLYLAHLVASEREKYANVGLDLRDMGTDTIKEIASLVEDTEVLLLVSVGEQLKNAMMALREHRHLDHLVFCANLLDETSTSDDIQPGVRAFGRINVLLRSLNAP